MVDLEIDESDKVIRCTSKSNREVFAELSVRDVLPTDVSGELSFNQVFYNMDAQKLIVGVDALNTQTNRYVTMGYLAFDVDVESVSNGEADFTLSNPGTYEFGGIKEHGKNKEDGYASGIINTADVKVRQLPDENAEVIILLPKNQEITILEALENYYKINCVLEGDMVVEGYVMKEFIE